MLLKIFSGRWGRWLILLTVIFIAAALAAFHVLHVTIDLRSSISALFGMPFNISLTRGQRPSRWPLYSHALRCFVPARKTPACKSRTTFYLG
jgi:hypothetical protein